jgi:HEAT repeat protein
VGLLVEVFEDDHRNRLWKDVAWLLWQIGDNIAMQAIDWALKHENHHVRAKLLQVFGEIHDVRTENILIQALGDDDWGVRRVAVNTLRQKKSQQAKVALINSLEDTNPDVKNLAVYALRSLGDT